MTEQVATRRPEGRLARLAAIVALVTLAGALLRLLALDKPIYIDEIITITVASQPLERMGTVMRQIDASPALYPLLLHAWLQVGSGDFWVRLLPAIFGILVVPVVAAVAYRGFGVRAAVAAAFVVAIAPAHVHYAQYVRGYSLLTLLAGLQLLLVIEWFEHPSRGRFLALAVVTAAALYTHYLALLLFLPEGLYAAWRFRDADARSRAMGWGAAVALALVLFVPGLPLFLHNLDFDRVRNEERPQPPPVVTLAPNLLAELSVGQRLLGFSDPVVRRATLAASAVLFPVLLVAGVRAGWRRNREATLLLALFAFLPLAFYVVSGRRLVAVRFFLPFMLGYVVLLGNGLVALRGSLRAVAVAALLTVCAVPLVHYYRHFTWGYDHRAVAAALEPRLGPRDVLLFVHPYEAFYYRWYLGDRVPMAGVVFTALEDQHTYVIKPPAPTLEAARGRVEAAAGKYDRLWVVGQSRRSFASDSRAEQRLLAWMDQRFERGADLKVTGGDPVIRCYDVADTLEDHQVRAER